MGGFMEEILALNAALALAEKLIPIIAERVRSGEVSVEEQAKAKAQYLELRKRGDDIFQASHWKA